MFWESLENRHIQRRLKMTKRKTTIVAAALAVFAFTGAAQAQFTLKFEGNQPLVQKRAGIAHIRVGALTETPAQQGLFGAQPGAAQTTHELVSRLEAARQDSSVRAVILDLNASSYGLGQLAEIRAQMFKLAAADKEVYVTVDTLSTASYALASAATHINVTPTGSVNLIGLHSSMAYLKGLLDMVGVRADFIHIGDFKTAAETITRDGPSDAAKAMSGWLYDDLYNSIISMIAEGRHVTPEKARALIDGGPYLAEGALAAGLIDSVEHQQDFINRIASQHGPIRANYGGGNENPFANMPDNPFGMFMELAKMLKGKPMQAVPGGAAIAIVSVDGAIHSGEQKVGLFGASKGAYSTTIRRALVQAMNDPTIKAVVLRVNSPGGSALASEVIWSAAAKLAKRKPLFVSMGNVAASGGYYVSTPARMIFVEPTTITGSIGVVGGKFVTTGGWGKLSVKWHTTQRGAHAGIYSSSTPFSEDERAIVRTQMETIYGVFKSRVTEGRGNKLSKPIDEIAGGRVYTGSQAIGLGLADKLGGVDDAIKAAARAAGIGSYAVVNLPAPMSLIQAMYGGENGGLSLGLNVGRSPAVQALLDGMSKVDPDGAAAVRATLGALDIIAQEKVATIDLSLTGE